MIYPIPCIVCGVAAARERWFINGYHIYTCTNCDMLFVHPRPSPAELAHFYDQSYSVPFARYAGNQRRNNQHIADLERWMIGRGMLLEVGASYGHSLAIARARGWQVAGVELSPTASAYGREHFKLPIQTCDLLESTFDENSFDAAIMWHVLEHTYDPVAQLARLWKLLRPGGVLGLRVPNAHSFGARVAGRSWVWAAPPGHLWYFSPHTLPLMLAHCGFELMEVATLRGDGDNLYQHMLVAFGGRLNSLRRHITTKTPSQTAPSTNKAQQPSTPLALRDSWLQFLQRAHPYTEALANVTASLVESLERSGWGDELLCYARRPYSS